MRVEPLTHLSELIASFFEAIAYPSMIVLAVMLLIAAALELRSRMRRPARTTRAVSTYPAPASRFPPPSPSLRR
jgi:hypothetical protein